MNNGVLEQWVTVEVDEEKAEQLAQSIAVPLPVAKVLLSRGVDSPESAEQFLNPRLSDLSDPFLFPGMQAAVDRIFKAIDGGERITVYGDYDADGVTSTALLMGVLSEMGGTVDSFIPQRLEDGYGFSIGSLQKVLENTNPSLIITADCGTRSSDVVDEAKSLGVDVVITDHHEGHDDHVPSAVAVINPKLAGPPKTESLAGVGVAFKLCHALVTQALKGKRPVAESMDLREYLDLVAIGTVADVVPLTGENRVLVRHGLTRLNSGFIRCGLQALMRVAGIRTKIDCYHLGFLIGPRINAAGRLGSADLGLALLMTREPGRAKRLAGQLDASNRERKRIEESIVEEAVEEVDASLDPETTHGLVVGRRGWHVGTIGIVAARLAGRYKRPAVVVSVDEDGLGRASCRSSGAVNLMSVLDACSAHLLTYGGHTQAAGATLKESEIDAFREAFNTACQIQNGDDNISNAHIVDAWISLKDANSDLVNALEALRPLGLGNQTPIWGTRKVRLQGVPKRVGNNHLKMTLASGGTQVDAIAFGMADRKPSDGELDVIYQVQMNHYMGKDTLQLSLKDFRPHVANQS